MKKNEDEGLKNFSNVDDVPEILKALKESVTPPEGMGNAHFVLNWTILLVLVPFLVYGLVYFEIPYINEGLLAYSAIILLLYVRLISGFKEHMAYESNPFDFVKIQFITFLNIVTYFGLIYFFLYKIDNESFNLAIDVFDGIYFSLVTVSTLGYGEIHPISKATRAVAMFELLVGIWFFVTVIPVAVADQAERLRKHHIDRQKIAEALKAGIDSGEIDRKDDASSKGSP